MARMVVVVMMVVMVVLTIMVTMVTMVRVVRIVVVAFMPMVSVVRWNKARTSNGAWGMSLCATWTVGMGRVVLAGEAMSRFQPALFPPPGVGSQALALINARWRSGRSTFHWRPGELGSAVCLVVHIHVAADVENPVSFLLSPIPYLVILWPLTTDVRKFSEI